MIFFFLSLSNDDNRVNNVNALRLMNMCEFFNG